MDLWAWGITIDSVKGSNQGYRQASAITENFNRTFQVVKSCATGQAHTNTYARGKGASPIQRITWLYEYNTEHAINASS